MKNFNNLKYLLLAVIIIFGIFLRAYNFTEWARFNDDQVRDALVVDRMVSGEEFPLLGPKAGGTHFNLGPAFYYFEYFSALIFGNTPASLAYPVLFFSILSIPFFYFVFKKIFTQKISLALTAVFAFSFFLIKYSRFAWNMNLIPFFVLAFVYLLDDVFEKNDEKKIFSSIFLGIVIGIGIQLHTLLLICFPAVFFLFLLIKFLKEKRIDCKKVIFVFLIALAVNVPQITYEAKTGGENLKAFFEGANSKTGNKISLGEKLFKNLSCQIQGNSFVLSAYGNNDECNIFQRDKESASLAYKANIFLSVVFFVGGLALILFFAFKKKYFWENSTLRIMFLYFVFSSLLFSFLTGEISLRLFIFSFFAPFLFLGFWLKIFLDKLGFFGKFLLIPFLLAALLLVNLLTFKGVYFPLGDMYRDDEFYGGASLGELNGIKKYVKENKSSQEKVNISKFENTRSLEYLLEKDKINVEAKSKEEMAIDYPEYFLIKKNDFRINKKKDKFLQKELENFEEKDSKIIGQYTVFKLKLLK